MLKAILLSLSFHSVESFAVELSSNCPIISDTLTDTTIDAQSERRLVIQYRIGGSRSYFDSLQFVIRNNETGIESIEDLFVQSKRGGYSISYCNPDDREYLPSIEKFSWHSVCTGASPFNRINGRVSLSKRVDGIVKIKAIREDFSSEEREISTGPCQ